MQSNPIQIGAVIQTPDLDPNRPPLPRQHHFKEILVKDISNKVPRTERPRTFSATLRFLSEEKATVTMRMLSGPAIENLGPQKQKWLPGQERTFELRRSERRSPHSYELYLANNPPGTGSDKWTTRLLVQTFRVYDFADSLRFEMHIKTPAGEKCIKGFDAREWATRPNTPKRPGKQPKQQV